MGFWVWYYDACITCIRGYVGGLVGIPRTIYTRLALHKRVVHGFGQNPFIDYVQIDY